jgi:SAM-dependent methyltransferase
VSPPRHVRNLCIASAVPIALIAWHFPYASDYPVRREDAVREFYELSYSGSNAVVRKDSELTRQAGTAAVRYDIRGRVERFVVHYGLQGASVLDVGSGRGYLQDVVPNYTGLDIAASVAKHYHKRFVAGTATAMPFADDEFDAVWSIWVLEHIPNPESALSEIRRVVRPAGSCTCCPPGTASRGRPRARTPGRIVTTASVAGSSRPASPSGVASRCGSSPPCEPRTACRVRRLGADATAARVELRGVLASRQRRRERSR